ncbi:hypothetical protein COU76_01515 [Candidatus Peregrinibacteria bacterium CG10_big_fil_rev_8_21_14_0_10_49_10]|nr:MAG: hypothetical protein COU76_01515 [Candidatus Peregrinibacteria bacterium CG10_big_fil_rev_8_21_14_0_10_49_10]
MAHFLHTLLGFFLIQTAHASVWDRYADVFGGDRTGRDFVAQKSVAVGNIALQFITGGAVLAIMWGGIKMISSAGNDEGKENAKKIVMYAVGGLIFAILSKAIIVFTHSFVDGFAG